MYCNNLYHVIRYASRCMLLFVTSYTYALTRTVLTSSLLQAITMSREQALSSQLRVNFGTRQRKCRFPSKCRNILLSLFYNLFYYYYVFIYFLTFYVLFKINIIFFSQFGCILSNRIYYKKIEIKYLLRKILRKQ